MSRHDPLPVSGYTPQSPEAVALANELKEEEERYLRLLDRLQADPGTDKRFLALAYTHMQNANMWAVRSIFQPKRIALPEDGGQ